DGAKNSALPIIAAAYLCDGDVWLENCPALSDVAASVEILQHLGCRTQTQGTALHIKPTAAPCCAISDGLMRKMRSSVIFLGALLARSGCAEISFPGGCVLGSRPIDLHLDGFVRLGAVVVNEGGRIRCTVPDGLKGAEISLAFPSVGATENLMIAACTARGETLLHNAAREPEIVDLADFLNKCGADITGAGESSIRIRGVGRLTGCRHTIIADRIVTATMLSAAVLTQGDLFLKNARADHLSVVLDTYRALGSSIGTAPEGIYISHRGRPRAVRSLRTMPYPGYPTDAQPLLVAALCCSSGTSVVNESIFENRFKYTEELCRMGARVTVCDRTAVIEGRNQLFGASVECTDLRGGAALTLAALAADGKSTVHNVAHVERGYVGLEQKLAALGADIKRIE
ncbi:MAG: UDP-N-acetylglucosamine 1-carboxyvinyltransferase, partial [Clostridia bacterium]|nr:UDP-N-acetylglucosamine 1-carboxyvinyltransferase [Clostridia bacterium]